MVLGGEGDLAGAERAFREATARDNENVDTPTTSGSPSCASSVPAKPRCSSGER